MAATPKKGAQSAKPAAKPATKAAPAAAKNTAAPAAARKPAAPAAATQKAGAQPAKAGGDDLKARFESAAAAAKQTKQRPDNATMLKLYSYYKQVTEGDVQGDRPGGFDFVGAAKYDAWAKLRGTSRDDAMQAYIKQVERLNRD